MSDSEDEMIVDNHEDDSNDVDDNCNDDEDDGSCDENHDRDDDKVGGESSDVPKKEPRQVYLPGHQMEEDESLVFDPSAYHMMHDIDSGISQCPVNL